MPIYEYHSAGQNSCDLCANVFEIMQKLSDNPLKLCPQCHNPVKRKISRPNLASQTPSLKQDNLEKHGFTQFKKVEKGVYEKNCRQRTGFHYR